MRQLMAQVIGKGKMIKTHFLNLEESIGSIDSRLNPEFAIAFIGYKLGNKWDYDPKKVAYISGNLDTELEILFQDYLNTLVMCQSCGYPELSLQVDDNKVKTNCQSCGIKGSPQLNEKMKKFILKHHK